MSKVGVTTTGGRSLSNRSPVSGNSADTRRHSAWTSAPTWCAGHHAHDARRPWPDRVRPLSSGPPESRSIQGRPSGVEHHLDDAHVLKEARDVGAERCAPSRSPTGIKFIVPHLGGAIPMLMNRHDKQGHGATGRRCHFGYVYFRKSGDTAVPNSMCLRIRPTSRAALIGAGSF